MNIHHIKAYWLKITCILIASLHFALGNGLSVVRPPLGDVGWSSDSTKIIEAFRINRRPPPDSKIALLFVVVKLGLGEPVADYGAVLREFAFVYSESADNMGVKTAKINVLVRSPYEDRKWLAEFLVMGHDESLDNVLVINPSLDLSGQLSEFIKRLINAPGPKDHYIAAILFEKAISEVFGKNLDDKAIAHFFPTK